MLLNTCEPFGTPSFIVMDPIHGGIPFFTHEKDVIDHVLFQRLRHIKQNDILFYVFPGATHTRFEHCVGTMHIAGKIFKSMIRNYLINRTQQDLTGEQIDAIQYCYGCLRLAALLHDVGHMPFSHQFEDCDAGNTLLTNQDIIKKLWTEELNRFIGSAPPKLSHESISVRCAYDILKSIPSLNFDIKDIIGMMENGFIEPSDKFCKHSLNAIKWFGRVPDIESKFSGKFIGNAIQQLFKDIISCEIDADKMDYLLRDSYFSGCNYGFYNLDHLSKNICLGYELDINPSNTWVGIALNKKGLGALEDFVHSRFRMYLQVYNHKTVVGFKWLVRNALSELLKEHGPLEFISRALSDIEIFRDFTDDYFWEEFRAYAKKHPDSACSYIVKRKKLKHLCTLRDKADFEKRIKKKELELQIGKKVVQHESSTRFSKISPTFSRMRLLRRDKIEDKYHLESILSASTFFAKFSDTIETHYYEDPSFP
jgi:HD superfamily phosphohydrolase